MTDDIVEVKYEDVRATLLESLFNLVGKIKEFDSWECPSCDLEEDGAQCNCKEGFEKFQTTQNYLFTTWGAIKELDDGQD